MTFCLSTVLPLSDRGDRLNGRSKRGRIADESNFICAYFSGRWDPLENDFPVDPVALPTSLSVISLGDFHSLSLSWDRLVRRFRFRLSGRTTRSFQGAKKKW